VMSSGLQHGHVLNADCYLLEAKVLWEYALTALRCDPLYFVSSV